MRIKSGLNWKLAALAVAAALVACGGSGGGGDNDSNPLGLNAVKVVGDSLSDSGTFANAAGGGRIASVQGSADEPNVLWVERVAKAYDVAPLCPVYKFDGQAFQPNAQPGCTNFAIGGGRINHQGAGGNDSPLSVLRQLRDAAAQGFGDKDLLLVDGGGNDAADLVVAYLSAPADQGAAYAALLGTLLPPEALQQVLAGENGAEVAGGVYMQALADHLTQAVNTQALAQGARHVVVANIPTITYTPRFQAVLAQIGATAGEAVRDQAEGLFKGWVNSFNQRLAANFSDEPRVQVFDLARHFSDQIERPDRYGLTNVTLPVCGGEGITVVPQRPLAECSAAELSATTPPPGAPAGADWWQRFMFADGFHPTPYGHQLFGEQVIELLDEVDWL